MRLIDYFPKSSISVIHSAKDWQEAIDFSMVSLLDKNYISENYIQAIKGSTINNGPLLYSRTRRGNASCAIGMWGA